MKKKKNKKIREVRKVNIEIERKDSKRRFTQNSFYLPSKHKKVYDWFWLIVLLTAGFLIAIYGYNKNIYRYDMISEPSWPSDNYILVFYQPNCIHCVAEFHVLLELKEKYGMKIKAVNILEHKDYINVYNVTSTPTMYLFFNNKSLKIKGEIGLEDLLKLINSLYSENPLNDLLIVPLKNKSCNINSGEKCE